MMPSKPAEANAAKPIAEMTRKEIFRRLNALARNWRRLSPEIQAQRRAESHVLIDELYRRFELQGTRSSGAGTNGDHRRESRVE
jgi:hypothetical protein